MSCELSASDQGFTCFWEIENLTFSEFGKDLILTSQIFSINMMNNSSWYLKLKQNPDGYFVLMIFKTDVPRGSIKMHFYMSFLTNCGWDRGIEGKDNVFIAGGKGYGFPLIKTEFVFSQKTKYLLNGSLTFACHMWNDTIKNKSAQCFLRSQMKNGKNLHFPNKYINGLKNSSWTKIYNYFNSDAYLYLQSKSFKLSTKQVKDKYTQTNSEETEDECNKTKYLLHFFAERDFSYVTLRTPNKEFAVHKALLCAKSPVFCAMFDKDMKENQKSVVDIDDLDNDTLTLFLQFLHLESYEDLDWTMTTKLYYAADKYQVRQLKNECRVLLKEKVSTENLCDLLVLSDMHQDSELKEYAQDYFCNHSKTILLTEEWKDLLLSRPELACEILRTYAEKS